MAKKLSTKKLTAIIICAVLLACIAVIFAWQANRVSSLDAVSENSQLIAGTIEAQAANLQKLAMVWGFTKYTHLAFLTGERCWDEELLALIPVVQFADPNDVNDILYEWFVGLGDDGFDNGGSVLLLVPFNEDFHDIWYFEDFIALVENATWLSWAGNTSGEHYHSAALRANRNYLEALAEDDESFGWLHALDKVDKKYMLPLIDMKWLTDESFLGCSLAAIFSRFNEVAVANSAVAPVTFDEIGNSNFSNQCYHSGMDFQDAGYRLLGLFRLYNAIKYFFPYIDIRPLPKLNKCFENLL